MLTSPGGSAKVARVAVSQTIASDSITHTYEIEHASLIGAVSSRACPGRFLHAGPLQSFRAANDYVGPDPHQYQQPQHNNGRNKWRRIGRNHDRRWRYLWEPRFVRIRVRAGYGRLRYSRAN